MNQFLKYFNRIPIPQYCSYQNQNYIERQCRNCRDFLYNNIINLNRETRGQHGINQTICIMAENGDKIWRWKVLKSLPNMRLPGCGSL